MTVVRANIDIDAPPDAVYEVMLDPKRLDEWVSQAEDGIRDVRL